MYLPDPVWLLMFAIGFPIVAFKAIKDPAWAAAAGAYTYFAIPTREFNAPGFPYQAVFFGMATIGAFRYYKLFSSWGKEEIIESAKRVAHEALDPIRPKLIEAIVIAAVQGKMRGEISREAIDAAEPEAIDFVEKHAPAAVSVAVRRAVQAAITTAADLGEREAVAVQEAQRGKTKGHLHAALTGRVPPLVEEGLDKALDETVTENIERQVQRYESDPDLVEKNKGRGPLGVPIPKGPIGGLLTNAGMIFHILFMLLTYLGAKNAVYSVDVAMSRYSTTVLLLIPLVGIVTSVRTAKHFFLFAFAWVFGTWHIAMNGVSYWLQYGGRADNAGGQGGESNFLGAIICAVAPIGFALALNLKDNKHRALSLGMAGCLVLGILASGSRAGLLAMFVGIGYWMMMTNRKAIAVGVLMMAASGFLVAAPEEFWERMGTIMGKKDTNPWVRNAVEPSKHERLVLWALAIKVFKERPVTGIGPMNYPKVAATETSITSAYAKTREMQAHNTWLQLIAEYGILGALVWGGGFLFSFWCYRSARVRMKGYKGWEWFPAICLGFEGGTLSTAVCLAFNSFQWYDYIYWHMVFGPVALQVARSTGERLDWLKPADLDDARPPPRYGPPTRDGLDIHDIDLAGTATVSNESRI